jgi:hypothetical protein
LTTKLKMAQGGYKAVSGVEETIKVISERSALHSHQTLVTENVVICT